MSVCPAIDMTANIIQSLEVVVSVGCERVLTSGGEASALEGSATIRKMIEQTAGRVTVVPGTDCALQCGLDDGCLWWSGTQCQQ